MTTLRRTLLKSFTVFLHLIVCCLQDKLALCPLIDKGGYYVSSTGKRLVHGDMCNSGLSSLIPDTDGKGALNPGAACRDS